MRIYISDCEGPISRNDNAFELSAHYIVRGDRFFSLVSKYDDVLADLVKRRGHKAGDTLRFILPFLKAYGATNKGVEEYCARSILLMPGAKESLKFIKEFMPTFIVSTSYEQYMRSLCDALDFPFDKVRCTKLDLDSYALPEAEEAKLKELARDIADMPSIEVPSDAKTIEDLSEGRDTFERLDKIFWEEIPRMEIGVLMKKVNPVGGYEKAKAVEEIVESLGGCELSDVVYVGDSITDVQSFQLVREAEGLTVSFNGNRYAVKEAEIAVLSENAMALPILADVFNRLGKEAVLKLANDWSLSTLRSFRVHPPLLKRFLQLHPDLPRVEVVRSDNMERLMQESSSFRKLVRGEAIGKLG